MAIYHCSIKTGGRAKGQSAVAAAAYRSGEKLIDNETGIISDYTRKQGVVYSEVALCKNAPTEYADREKLWNAVHEIEKSNNARLWREIEIALPQEMSREEQIKAVREYVGNLTDRGMCADWSLHDKGDGNPHAHIMLTTRSIEANGKWAPKSHKIYDIDENGQKIPLIDKNTGVQKVDSSNRKQWKNHKENYNDWDENERIEEWREAWANICNQYLSEEKRIDHRSFERQGIERVPTIHEGYVARQIEANGGISDRCEKNREIKLVIEQLKNIANELKQLVEQKGSAINDRIGELLRRREASKSERGITDGERTVEGAVAQQSTKNTDTLTGDTDALIRQAEVVGTSAKTNIANTTASRADREAFQQRQRIEAERRNREESERASKNLSRGGPSL